jgi:hypothetical protein
LQPLNNDDANMVIRKATGMIAGLPQSVSGKPNGEKKR